MVDRFRDRRLSSRGTRRTFTVRSAAGNRHGIQDATICLENWRPVTRRRPDALLDTFDEERKPIARAVLRGTSTASNLVFAMNPVLRFVREKLVFPILRTGFVQRRLIGNASQLEVNYRGRSLAARSGKASSRVRVRAGDRAPDVLFKRGDEKVTLFRLIGTFGMLALFGPGQNSLRLTAALATLHIRSFIVSTQSAGTLPDEYLEDLYADFARLYGAQGPFLYLLRPIACRAFSTPGRSRRARHLLKKIPHRKPWRKRSPCNRSLCEALSGTRPVNHAPTGPRYRLPHKRIRPPLAPMVAGPCRQHGDLIAERIKLLLDPAERRSPSPPGNPSGDSVGE